MVSDGVFETLMGFFTLDVDRALAAVAAIETASCGCVTTTDTLYRKDRIRFASNGLFDEAIFGEAGTAARGQRWGHVAAAGLVHPAVGLADTDPRLLPLREIRRIPVPPVAMRPLVEGLAPTMVDPWIGPVNTRWLELINRANRHARLIELGAPEEIVEVEAELAHQALQAVFEAHQPSAARLVPPLREPCEPFRANDALAIAYVDPSTLVAQQPSGVHVIADDGRVIHAVAASGLRLTGVVDDRVAIFTGHIAGIEEVQDAVFSGDAMTALDCKTGAYLTERPAAAASPVWNDQPEDLFFTDPRTGKVTQLFVGGDRPETIATTRDGKFAWIGEIGSGTTTQIIDLATGIPHALPAEPEVDYEAESFGAAIAWRAGKWHLLWHYGTYAEHDGAGVFSLGTADAGAFSPDGSRLAVIAGAEIKIFDITTRTLVRSFALP